MKIRTVINSDLHVLQSIATAMRAVHEAGYFERCLAEQVSGNRVLLLAEGDNAEPLGYVQLIWSPVYPLFRRMNIPEIQDLNVIPDARHQGIGAALVDACEALAREKGHSDMGISVGLHSGFGSAQRLYIRKGYLPDGAGIAYDEITVTAGEMRSVDDLLMLKMTKTLV